MEKLIKKLKFWVLLTGVIFLSSCSNHTSRVPSIGINTVCRTIPSMAIRVTRYTESKISGYLMYSSGTQNVTGKTVKKTEKTSGNLKSKPVSIGIAREARLI